MSDDAKRYWVTRYFGEWIVWFNRNANAGPEQVCIAVDEAAANLICSVLNLDDEGKLGGRP